MTTSRQTQKETEETEQDQRTRPNLKQIGGTGYSTSPAVGARRHGAIDAIRFDTADTARTVRHRRYGDSEPESESELEPGNR